MDYTFIETDAGLIEFFGHERYRRVFIPVYGKAVIEDVACDYFLQPFWTDKDRVAISGLITGEFHIISDKQYILRIE